MDSCAAGPQLPPDDPKSFSNGILLNRWIIWIKLGDPSGYIVYHAFELRNQLGCERWVIGQLYGMTAKFRKKPEIARGNKIGALDPFVRSFDFIAEKRVDNCCGTFSA